jgi:hypothetical protein
MWKASPLKKVRGCRRWAYDHDNGMVQLTGRRREDGGLDVGWRNLQTCASWHSCLQCGVVLSLERARELEHAARVWHELGGHVVLATFTARHHRGLSLRELVDGQRTAWGFVTSDRPWGRDRDRLGIRYVIRAFESTHGDEHGWHPHFHVLLFCDPRWTTTREVAGEYRDARGKLRRRYRKVTRPPWQRPDGSTVDPRELAPAPLPQEPVAKSWLEPAWARWCEGLASVGMSAVGSVERNGVSEDAGFEVSVMNLHEDATGLAAYPFKLALEAVGGVFKHGGRHDREGRPVGKRHRTPFEVMESYAVAVAEGDRDAAAEDRRIITEWSETATDMRFRQAPWPPGMRAQFREWAPLVRIDGPLLRDERSDQEIVDAEAKDAETLADVPATAYSDVVVWEMHALKATARAGGWPALLAWFDRRGIAIEPREHGLTDARAPGAPPGPHDRAVQRLWSDVEEQRGRS